MQTIKFESTVEQLKPYLESYLQEHGVDTSKSFLCLFPEHKDTRPSCGLVGDKTRFHCLGCGKGGDIFDAAYLLENRPRAGKEWIQETLVFLATKYGVAVEHAELTESDIYEIDTYRAYKVAAGYITLGFTEKQNPALHAEMKKRGWTPETLKDQGIGTVKSYDDFYNALIAEGFPRKFLQEIDLNRKDIFNPDNLIFTWKDENGRAIGFTARNLNYEQEKKEAEAAGEKYAGKKYNNQRTTGLKVNIFQKGRRLYGIDKARTAPAPLYIFEGQADVITARINGLANCVAIAGSALHDDHIQLLRQLHIYDVVLCLDGDEVGQKKLGEILEKKFAGKRDIRVRVVIMPFPEDPDSFIRTKGVEAFRKLAHWTAFEWKLNQYSEDYPEQDLCHQMIPLIVNEPSPVSRDAQCKDLAKRTGISLKAITEELNQLLDTKSHHRKMERQTVLDSLVYDVQSDPEHAELVLQKAQSNLLDLTRRHSSDVLSNEEFVRCLDEQKENEENLDSKDTSLKLGNDLRELQEYLRGEWNGVFICVGGKPNVGKTAFLSKFAYEIANNNPSVCVICHTIDDTSEQMVPRFVALAEGSRKLSLNMVRQPNYWTNVTGLTWLPEKREVGYKHIRELAEDGRLVVKDINHGMSVPFIENLIIYYQNKYPDRQIVYVLDNFHKLRDFDSKDERVRFKALSETMKGIATRRKCAIISTVEYTKLAPGIKPTNHNIGESGQIEYDANAIIHLYSEVSDQPESFNVCHVENDYRNQKVYLPRVEFIVAKNKISELKGSFFLDFFPASSDYRYVDLETVQADAQSMKDSRNTSRDDEVPNLTGDDSDFSKLHEAWMKKQGPSQYAKSLPGKGLRF